jgi:plastocyanin
MSSVAMGAGPWWPTQQRTPQRREIQMRGNSFAPREVRVAVGDTVVWVNGDIVRHNAVQPALFDSGELRSGERFAWVPVDTGTVRYQCTIHSRMRGVVRVTEPR